MPLSFPSAPYHTEDVLLGRYTPDPEVRDLNDWIIETLSAGPWIWKFSEEQIREARRKGAGVFPIVPTSEQAKMLQIDSPAGKISLRLIWPTNSTDNQHDVTRAYLHSHGGGWTFGAADMQDPMLQNIADACHCLCVSIDYPLAPENPYPAAQDACEAAALWLVGEAAQRYGLHQFAIGGESAGAHLSLCTLLRLKERGLSDVFCAANLVCGCYDLSLSPSVRTWGETKLVLNTDDIMQFRKRYLTGAAASMDWNQPDISPLYGVLTELPAMLITAGAKDPLLDDSLFLHQRLLAAGIPSQLALYPDGCHVFPLFDIDMGRKALRHSEAFLNSCFDA